MSKPGQQRRRGNQRVSRVRGGARETEKKWERKRAWTRQKKVKKSRERSGGRETEGEIEGNQTKSKQKRITGDGGGKNEAWSSAGIGGLFASHAAG